MEAFLKPFMEAGYTWVGREHWATGLMVGLTAPVALFLANPEWGVPEKLGVFVGFAAVALKYGQQNKEEVTQFWFGCAISLFLVAVVAALFRGATTFDSNILAWAPVFLCATLMMAVNIAPKVTQAMKSTWQWLPITIHIGSSSGAHREMDLEQGVYQDHYSEAGEIQSGDSTSGSIDLNSVAPTTSSIQALMGLLEGSSGHDLQEPVNQIGPRVVTQQRSMLGEKPPWSFANRTERYSSPVRSAATMPSSREVETSEQYIG